MRARAIEDGDLCRLYNARGETFGYAIVLEGMLPGVIGTQKQFKGSNTPGGINVNALVSDELTDFGRAPSFYSCLAEVEKTDDATAVRARWQYLGGEAGYVRAMRKANPGSTLSDEEILATIAEDHPGLRET